MHPLHIQNVSDGEMGHAHLVQTQMELQVTVLPRRSLQDRLLRQVPFLWLPFCFRHKLFAVYVERVRRQWFGSEDQSLWCLLSCLRSFLSSRRRVSGGGRGRDVSSSVLMVSQLHAQRCHKRTLWVCRAVALWSDQMTPNNPGWQSETRRGSFCKYIKKLKHIWEQLEPLPSSSWFRFCKFEM